MRKLFLSVLLLLLFSSVYATSISFTEPLEGSEFNLGQTITAEGYVTSTDNTDVSIILSLDGTELSSLDTTISSGQVISFENLFDIQEFSLNSDGNHTVSLAIREGTLTLIEESFDIIGSNNLTISVGELDETYNIGDTILIEGFVSGVGGLFDSEITLTYGELSLSQETVNGFFSFNFTGESDVSEATLSVSEDAGNEGSLELQLFISKNLVIEPGIEILESGNRHIKLNVKVYNSQSVLVSPDSLNIEVSGADSFNKKIKADEEIKFSKSGEYELKFIATQGDLSGVFIRDLTVKEGLGSAKIDIAPQMFKTSNVNYKIILKDSFGEIMLNSNFYIVLLGPESSKIVEKHQTNSKGKYEGKIDTSEALSGSWSMAVIRDLPVGFDENSELASLQFLDVIATKNFEIVSNLDFNVVITSRDVIDDEIIIKGYVENVGNLRGDDVSIIIDCPQCENTHNILKVSLDPGERYDFEEAYATSENLKSVEINEHLKLFIPNLKNLFFNEFFSIFLITLFFSYSRLRKIKFNSLMVKIPSSLLFNFKYNPSLKRLKESWKKLMLNDGANFLITTVGAALVLAIAFDISNSTGAFFKELLFLSLIIIITFSSVHKWISLRYSTKGTVEFWPLGSLLLFITALIFGVPFGSPYRLKGLNKSILTLLNPLFNLIFAVVAILIYANSSSSVVAALATMSITLAFFHMIPVKSLNGDLVLKAYHNLWFGLFVLVMFVYVWIKIVMPWLVFV
jgi:hypothetical protein